MDFPRALDTALKALLTCHSVSSWKIAAEGLNPTVILRLRPVHVPALCHNGVPEHVNTVAFRRKSPSQMHRDQQRMERFRQRDRTGHVCMPESNVEVSDHNAFLVNEHVISSDIPTDTPCVVVCDKDSVSDSRSNDGSVYLDSAASVTGTCVTQGDGSGQEVSDAEGDAESDAATPSTPRTDSSAPSAVAAVSAGVSAEDTAKNEDTPAPRAEQGTENGAHGGAESGVESGSLSLRKYVCQDIQSLKSPREVEKERDTKSSDTRVRCVNLQDSGIESLRTRDESTCSVSFDSYQDSRNGGHGGGVMREGSLGACGDSGSAIQGLANTVYGGHLPYPYSQTDNYPRPMFDAMQYWSEMNAQRLTMPQYATYPSYTAPLPGMSWPTLPPVSVGGGAGLSFEGPSVEVSDKQITEDSKTLFGGCDTLSKEKKNVEKGMNEDVDRCTKGGKMSNVVQRGVRNNERYGRERKDMYRRDDDEYRGGRGNRDWRERRDMYRRDEDQYRGGRGYRDNARFRGGSARRPWDYQDRDAR